MAPEMVAIDMTKAERMQSMPSILARVEAELSDLAACVDDLHKIVEIVGDEVIRDKAKFYHSAQSIDIVEQRLSGLAHFVSELANMTPAHWSVDCHVAASKLKLSALAKQLSSHDGHHASSHQQAAGESEFF